MKTRIPVLITALLAAGAVSAQAPKPAPDAAAPTPVIELQLADQPMVSVATGSRGPHVEIANAIAQAIAAEPSLRKSKITVAPEENKILLTGVTPTVQQMGRVSQIAAQHAGQLPVINGINTEEVFLEPNPTGAVSAEAMPAGAPATAG